MAGARAAGGRPRPPSGREGARVRVGAAPLSASVSHAGRAVSLARGAGLAASVSLSAVCWRGKNHQAPRTLDPRATCEGDGGRGPKQCRLSREGPGAPAGALKRAPPNCTGKVNSGGRQTQSPVIY